MSSSTVSASVAPVTKNVANNIIRKKGLTPNEVIRRLWNYIADNGDLPAVLEVPNDTVSIRLQALAKMEQLSAQLFAGSDLATMSDDDIEQELHSRNF